MPVACFSPICDDEIITIPAAVTTLVAVVPEVP